MKGSKRSLRGLSSCRTYTELQQVDVSKKRRLVVL
jgi:hypothetical protein